MSRRPKHDPKESEREILVAAEEFLRERPFREMTVDAVMSRTGLKRPAFYVHFRDRHDLALRVVEQLGMEIGEMVDRWLVAAAAINTVQLICGAFGAGLAGIVVNTVDRPDAVGASWLFAVFAGLAALGCVASYRAGQGSRS